MRNSFTRCLTIVLSLAPVLSVVGPAMARQDAPEPYLRVTDDATGNIARLEVAVREFTPPAPDQPVVFLAGAVHIADRGFYDALQAFLDAQDIVLFEGVKPAGAGREEHDEALDEPAKIRKTRQRVRFLAIAVESYHSKHGSYPATLEEAAAGIDPRLGSLVGTSMMDAWGHPVAYVLSADAPSTFDVQSLGSDGKPGGEGSAADVKFSQQKPLSDGERGRGANLQQQLANAFGLVFQLDAMDHDKANWRNSDMSIDQVQRRLDDSGAGADALFGMLDGSSTMARFTGFLLKMIGSTATGRTMFKLMLVEMLSRADEMLEMLPGDMGSIVDELIKDRNAVVITDLRRLIETEPAVRTVGVIYGAGHLPDLERRMIAELGYTPGTEIWNAAIAVDLNDGLPRGQGRQMREMIRQSLEIQIRQLKKMK